MLTVNNLTGFGGGGPSPDISCSYTAGASSTGSGNPYTFSSLSIGAAPSSGERRFVFAVCGGHDIGSFQSMTIGGSAATYTLNNTASGGGQRVTIGYREISTGTTATIVYDTSSAGKGGACAVFRLICGPRGISIHDTGESAGSGSESITLDFLKGGVGFAGAQNQDGGSFSWSGLTERFSADMEGSDYFEAAMSTFSAEALTTTVTANPGASDNTRLLGLSVKKL